MAPPPSPAAATTPAVTEQTGQFSEIDEHLENPVHLPAQSERIARARRLLSGVEHPDDGIELVGERHRCPRHGRLAKLLPRRRRISGNRVGQVVVVNRLPHALGLPLLARVDAAHHSLQLRQFRHHLGGEIGFRETARCRRRIGQRWRRQGLCGNPSCQRLDALRLLEIAPELLVESNRPEPLDARFERNVAIGIPEETRITQPRRQHALVIARDRLLVDRIGVGHDQKGRLQPPGFVDNRKIMLMMNHRRRQHFFRKGEKFLREGPGHHRRVLDRDQAPPRAASSAASPQRRPAPQGCGLSLRARARSDPAAPADRE